MDTVTASFEELIAQAKDKIELGNLAEKIGLAIDGRMLIENARKALLESYQNMKKESEKITKEAVKTVASTSENEPMVRMRFGILDILNADEAPLFEFVNDGGRGVKKGQIAPKWSFIHGQVYDVPFSIYEFLSGLTIPRSRYVPDPNAPGGQRVEVYTQKRFNCELIVSKDQMRKLQVA